MPHHFTKATVEASAYCPTCGKMTPHYVHGGILGRCKNDHPHPKPIKKDETQGNLFRKKA